MFIALPGMFIDTVVLVDLSRCVYEFTCAIRSVFWFLVIMGVQFNFDNGSSVKKAGSVKKSMKT